MQRIRRQVAILYLVGCTLYLINIRDPLTLPDRWRPQNFRDGDVDYKTDEWQYIGDPTVKYQVYSAYFDERVEIFNGSCPMGFVCHGTVRIIALMFQNLTRAQLHCNYAYPGGSIQKLAPIQIDSVYDTKRFNTFMVVCPLFQRQDEPMEWPVAVGITYDGEPSMQRVTSLVKIHYADENAAGSTIAVCTNPLFNGYGDVRRIVEFVELQKLLGASTIYMYERSVSADLHKLLLYYSEAGDVVLLQWNISSRYKFPDFFFRGISACFNDCYYRASFQGQHEYILMIDTDEIVMPVAADSLPALLQAIDGPSFNSFIVPNVFVMPSNLTDASFLYTQSLFQRTGPEPPHIRSKVIAKGKWLVKLSNHKILTGVNGTEERPVTAEEALLFHYRNTVMPDYEYGIEDRTALKFGAALRQKVAETCRSVFGSETCPMHQ